MNTLPVRIVFSTIDSRETAHAIARQLVEERLAACVSIITDVFSVYKWKGAVEESREWLLIIKTPSDRLEALMARIRSLHPYETPEIVSFSIEHGYPPYLEWVVAETRPSSHQD